MKETYTKAVLELLQTQTDVATVATGLNRVLKARGHERLALPVWQAVLRTLRAGTATEAVVYVDNEADLTVYQAEIAALVAELGGEATFTTKTDDTLIGGYVVEANKQRIDRSYKTQLLNLYRSITT